MQINLTHASLAEKRQKKVPSYWVINLGRTNFLRVHTPQLVDKNIDCSWI